MRPTQQSLRLLLGASCSMLLVVAVLTGPYMLRASGTDADPLSGLPSAAELQKIESSQPWGTRLNAQPSGHDAPVRLADGCRHVFIDMYDAAPSSKRPGLRHV